MNDIHTLQAFCGVLQREDAPVMLSQDLETFLTPYELTRADVLAMSKIGSKPLLMYRTMVHTRLKAVIMDWIPRTIARLGQNCFHHEFIAFMAEEAPKTAYLRQVPREFVTWVIPRWQVNTKIPTYMADLARHELLYGDVYNLPKGGEPDTGQPMALDRPLRVDGTVSVICYDYAVHRLSAALHDRSEPAQERTNLLVYRDREEHKVHYLELSGRAAEVTQRLLQGQTLKEALQGASEATQQPLDDEFLASMVHFFADLSERKILLGAE